MARRMRLWLALAFIAVPGVAAHGEPTQAYLGHTQLVTTELLPGAHEEWVLAYNGNALPADWHLLIHIEVAGDDAATSMRLLLHEELGNWSLGAGTHTERLLLGHTGTPTLQLANTGNATASVRWYYDHTCDCSAKVVPIPGPVWLNMEAQRGQRVVVDLQYQPMQTRIDGTPLPGNVSIQASQLLPGYERGAHVAQAHVLAIDAPCEETLRWNGCLQLSFTAPHDGMQLVWVEAGTDAPTWAVAVHPVFDTVQDAKSPAGPAGLYVLVAAGAVVALAGHRRAT